MLKQPPVRITTVINNRMHDSGPAQPRDSYPRTVRGTHSAPLHSGLRADYNGILPSHCMGHEQRTSLFESARWLTLTSYRRTLLATAATNVSRGWQTSSCTSAPMQPSPSRCMLYGPDRSSRMASRQSKRIDQRQPQRAGGARVGRRG